MSEDFGNANWTLANDYLLEMRLLYGDDQFVWPVEQREIMVDEGGFLLNEEGKRY